jgi:hypothetical protein
MLENAPDLPEPVLDSFTGVLCEPFAWYDQARPVWRTWQRCIIEGWATFSGPWPRSGYDAEVDCIPASTLALPMTGTVPGLLPTPAE